MSRFPKCFFNVFHLLHLLCVDIPPNVSIVWLVTTHWISPSTPHSDLIVVYKAEHRIVGTSIDMATFAKYPYRPLTEPDSIRLLCLQPTSFGTCVSARLVHTSFSECDFDIIDSYTALSYVWGDSTKRKTIAVDSTVISISSNLYNALFDIRDDSRTIRL